MIDNTKELKRNFEQFFDFRIDSFENEPTVNSIINIFVVSRIKYEQI